MAKKGAGKKTTKKKAPTQKSSRKPSKHGPGKPRKSPESMCELTTNPAKRAEAARMLDAIASDARGK